MKEIKVYVAGKVSKNSVFGTHDWRDAFCGEIAQKSDIAIINLDPTKKNGDFDLDQNNAALVFGRNAYMIKLADLIIVNLTDDISVGGSQEMIIARYFQKPVIGLAPRNGKFNKDTAEYYGKIFRNYRDPYITIPCDFIAENNDDIALFIKDFFADPTKHPVKDMSIIDDALKYYEEHYLPQDSYLHFSDSLGSPTSK